MEDPFNGTTFSFRTDRLGRMRDLITQIKADQECCRKLLLKLDTGRGDQSDIEELQRTTAWLHRNLAIYKKIQSSGVSTQVAPPWSHHRLASSILPPTNVSKK